MDVPVVVVKATPMIVGRPYMFCFCAFFLFMTPRLLPPRC